MIIIKKSVYIFALHLAYGGVEKAVSCLASMLAEYYEVTIISVYNMPDSPAFEIDERVNIKYLLKEIPNRNEFKEAVNCHNPLKIITEGLCAVRIIILKKIKIISAMHAIKNGTVITTRDEDTVLANLFCRGGVRKIAQLHQDHGFEKKFVRHFKYSYSNIDVFSLLSPKMASEVKTIMKNNHKTEVVCIPNFIDSVPECPGYNSRNKTVIAVGRLDRVKGFDRLIDVFCSVHQKEPEWILKIVGDGAEEKTLREMISQRNAEAFVILTGKLNPDDVEKEMQKASIYAMSSYSEAFGYVLVEAMCAMLPIVAVETRSSLQLLVNNGENGYLVDTVYEFEDALMKLINDNSLRRTMAEKSYESAFKFSKEKVSEQWVKVIEGEACGS